MASTIPFWGASLQAPHPLSERDAVLVRSPLSLSSPTSMTAKLLGGLRPLRLKRPSSASWSGGERLGRGSFVIRCEASGARISQQEFTEMAWQGIVSSPEIAKENKHQIVETEHLMKALLEQKNGLARRIFSKAGLDNTRLLDATDKFIQRQPKVIGESSGSMLGRDLEAQINRAREYKKKYGDSFVSIEHLILGFSDDQRFGRQLFRDFQISQQTLKSAVEAIRGRQSVIDQAIDLVDEAAAKLKMEITSKPTALDEINRSVLKLEMEKLSLANDTDRASKDRSNRLEAELSLLKEKQSQLTEQWEHEKSIMTHLQSIKEEISWISVVEISLLELWRH
ncbi:hypothetical protein SAY87_008928 [Trapa incisa]|uniref:Clp R domain-containing protein n=1 Tax=Trapa incisa TaxID=236973 RepID=A0AAN7JW58_9MYRT|nr:hypothetical protein SAY87_008928 [Trapa incisa]